MEPCRPRTLPAGAADVSGPGAPTEGSDGNYARPHLPGPPIRYWWPCQKEPHDQIMAERAEAVQADMAMADPELSRRDGSFDRRDPEHIAAAVEYTRSATAGDPGTEHDALPTVGGIIGQHVRDEPEEAPRIPKDLRDEEAKRYRQGARYAGMDDDDLWRRSQERSPKPQDLWGGSRVSNENPIRHWPRRATAHRVNRGRGDNPCQVFSSWSFRCGYGPLSRWKGCSQTALLPGQRPIPRSIPATPWY